MAPLSHTGAVLAELPRDAAEDLLARLDRVVPGRIEGFYVVGSASMGAFRSGRSDVDFVAIVDGDLRPAELRRLRAMHVGGWVSALIHDTALRQRWPLVCNGVDLKAGDLSRSPLEVTPLAGHVAGRFRAALRTGFDVNPVTWYVLAHHGIALRGPDRDHLEVMDRRGRAAGVGAGQPQQLLAPLGGSRTSRRPEHQGRPATALGDVGRARSAAIALLDRDRRNRDQGRRGALRPRSVRPAVARANRGRHCLLPRRTTVSALQKAPAPPPSRRRRIRRVRHRRRQQAHAHTN